MAYGRDPTTFLKLGGMVVDPQASHLCAAIFLNRARHPKSMNWQLWAAAQRNVLYSRHLTVPGRPRAGATRLQLRLQPLHLRLQLLHFRLQILHLQLQLHHFLRLHLRCGCSWCWCCCRHCCWLHLR